MKQLTILIIFIAIGGFLRGKVAINKDGSTSHLSAMLEVAADGKGVLKS